MLYSHSQVPEKNKWTYSTPTDYLANKHSLILSTGIQKLISKTIEYNIPPYYFHDYHI